MQRIMSPPDRTVYKLAVLLYLCACVAASTVKDDNSTETTTSKQDVGSSESETSLVETSVQLDGQETRPRPHSYTYSKIEAGYGQQAPAYSQYPETDLSYEYGKREKPLSHHYKVKGGSSYHQPESSNSDSSQSDYAHSFKQYEQRHLGSYAQNAKPYEEIKSSPYAQQKDHSKNSGYDHENYAKGGSYYSNDHSKVEDKSPTSQYEYEEQEKQHFLTNGDSDVKNYGIHSNYGSDGGKVYQSNIPEQDYEIQSNYGSQGGQIYQSKVPEVENHSSYGSQGGKTYHSNGPDESHSSYGSQEKVYQSIEPETHSHSNYGSSKGTSYQSGVSDIESHSNYGSPKGTAYQSAVSAIGSHSSYGSPKGTAYHSSVSDIGSHSNYGSPKGTAFHSSVSDIGSYSNYGSPKGKAFESSVSDIGSHSTYGSPKGKAYESSVSDIGSHSNYGPSKGKAYESSVSDIGSHSNYGSPKGKAYESSLSDIGSHSNYGSPKGKAYESSVSDIGSHLNYGSPKGKAYESSLSDIGSHSNYGSSKGKAYESSVSDLGSHSNYGVIGEKSYATPDVSHSISGEKDYQSSLSDGGSHSSYGPIKEKSHKSIAPEFTSYFYRGVSKGYRSSPSQHESGDYTQGDSDQSGGKVSHFPVYPKESGYISGGFKQPEYLRDSAKTPAYHKSSGYHSISQASYPSGVGKEQSSGGSNGGNVAVFIKQLGHSPSGDKYGSKNGERNGYLLLPVAPGKAGDKIKISTAGVHGGLNVKEVQDSHSPIYKHKPVYENTGKESYSYSNPGISTHSGKAYIDSHYTNEGESGSIGQKSSGHAAYNVNLHKGNNEYSSHSSLAENPKGTRYSSPVLIHNGQTSHAYSQKGARAYGGGHSVSVAALKDAGGLSDSGKYVQADEYEKQTPYINHGYSSLAISTSPGHSSKGTPYENGKTSIELPISYTSTHKGSYGHSNGQYAKIPSLSYGGGHDISQENGKHIQTQYETQQPLGYSNPSALDYSSQKHIDVKGKDFHASSYPVFTPIINPHASVVDFSSPKGSYSRKVISTSPGYVPQYKSSDGGQSIGYGSLKSSSTSQKNPKSFAIILQKAPSTLGSYKSSSSPVSYNGFKPILPQTRSPTGDSLAYHNLQTFTGLSSYPAIEYRKDSIKS